MYMSFMHKYTINTMCTICTGKKSSQGIVLRKKSKLQLSVHSISPFYKKKKEKPYMHMYKIYV